MLNALKPKLALIRAAKRILHKVGEHIGEAEFTLSLHQWLRDNFQPRSDDIYVATFPKSGTTWMQMLLYQLTTAGDMNFDHIYEVSPWLAGDPDGGVPPYGDTDALRSPRIFKIHLPYRALPRNWPGRFIVVNRDCLDVAASMLHHRRALADPTCTFDEVFDGFIRGGGVRNWFTFTSDWARNKHGRPVLMVRYEDMKHDLERVARRIIAFCNLTVDEREMPRILERSSFAFMKQHQGKFGEREEKAAHRKVFDNFIRKGETGEGRQHASEAQLAFVRKAMRRLPPGVTALEDVAGR